MFNKTFFNTSFHTPFSVALLLASSLAGGCASQPDQALDPGDKADDPIADRSIVIDQEGASVLGSLDNAPEMIDVYYDLSRVTSTCTSALEDTTRVKMHWMFDDNPDTEEHKTFWSPNTNLSGSVYNEFFYPIRGAKKVTLWISCEKPAGGIFTDEINNFDLEDAPEAKKIISCNEGAMEVYQEQYGQKEFFAVVKDQGVINWFTEQSKQTYVTTNFNGQPTTVQKEFPWMVEVSEDGGTKTMTIVDFRDYGNWNYQTSGPGGVVLRPWAQGLDLIITGLKMTSSHSVSYYDVGTWFFEQCEST